MWTIGTENKMKARARIKHLREPLLTVCMMGQDGLEKEAQ